MVCTSFMSHHCIHTYVVVNDSLVVFIGEPVMVRETIQVTIDCGQLIDEAVGIGILNPTITWLLNDRILPQGGINVEISADNRSRTITDTLIAVGGQLGTEGDYTCRVCDHTTSTCVSRSTEVAVCSK